MRRAVICADLGAAGNGVVTGVSCADQPSLGHVHRSCAAAGSHVRSQCCDDGRHDNHDHSYEPDNDNHNGDHWHDDNHRDDGDGDDDGDIDGDGDVDHGTCARAGPGLQYQRGRSDAGRLPANRFR